MLNKEIYVKVSVACAELGVSEIQIMDWIENHQLRTAVYCPSVKGILAYGKRNGVAMATLEGFCRLKYGDLRRLMADESVRATWFRPVDWRFITIDNYNCTLKTTLPNILFDTWQGAVDTSIPAPDYIFYPMPSYQADLQKIQAGMSAESLIEVIKNTPKGYNFENFCSLVASSHSFKLEQLRVWLPDLASIKTKKLNPEIHENNEDVSLRPFDKLICYIFKLYPNYRCSEVWKLLMKDVLKTDRIYDKEEILDEVGNKQLYWYDLNGELVSLKRQSFYTLVDRLRKKGYV